ncbi:helix-turn-helix domain-containing protein [Candidatus Avoscillospira sp. LCP25S3_F1]|uniref:helix-turn-helix domain-containing protein n=1 Tax=Candidatus Avoscillospira sp. LCP25S3_F1 TaxID=3438825 RepID=UPI003F92ACDF
MEDQTVLNIESVIDFIENNLSKKLDLETVASGVHYSKYYVHRMFSEMLGMTIHDYVQRRQLTEAAKLLVFSAKPILEIALTCGYESQQAFTTVFKAMYKIPPAEYRERQEFYPLQLRFSLEPRKLRKIFSSADIRMADESDIPGWMWLVRLVVDGYPVLNENDYLQKLRTCIDEQRALILKDGNTTIGVLAFSYNTGSIEFMGVHPQYRNYGLQKLFLDQLMEKYLPGQEISTTTYREHDKADTGYRKELELLGFAERELLIEFGYPTQRFVLPPSE